MATPLAYTAQFSFPSARVRAAIADKQYWQDRLTAVGGPASHLESVTADPDSVRIEMVQTIPADMLPPAVTAIRPGDLVIPRTEQWHGDQATFHATVTDAPVTINGTMTLATDATRPDAAQLSVEGTIEVKVPLFGAKIEKAVAEELLKLLADETEFTNTWLAEQ